MGQAKSKVMPAHQKQLEEELERWSRKKYKKRDRRIFGMLLRAILNRYGGRRHPVLDTFETLMKRKLLTELSFIPRGSVIIYISHQWLGLNHPDRYVWIDWSSMPQPSACPPGVDEGAKKELGIKLGKAVKSIPAYVFTFLAIFI